MDISNPLLCCCYSQLNFAGFKNDCKIYLTSLELYILASLVSGLKLCKPKDKHNTEKFNLKFNWILYDVKL